MSKRTATQLDTQLTAMQQRLTCDIKVPGCCLMVAAASMILFSIIHVNDGLQQLAVARAVCDTNRTVTLPTGQQHSTETQTER